MSCSTALAGLLRDCAQSVGGVKAFWLAPAADVTSVTISSGEVTAITMASSKKLMKYAINAESSSMTSTATINRAQGTKYVQTDLVAAFAKMSATSRAEVSAILQDDMVALVLDNNGTYFLLGAENPAYCSAAAGQTGQAMGDANQFSVTITDMSGDVPPTVKTGTGGVDVSTIVDIA